MKTLTVPVEKVNDCAFAYDLDSCKVIFISRDIEGLSGYDISDLQTNNSLLFKLIEAAEGASLKERAGLLINNERTFFKANIICVTGQLKQAFARLDLTIDETSGNRILHGLISETKEKNRNGSNRTNEELIWIKNNMEALINNTEDMIWSVDREARYVYMNRSCRANFEQLSGIAAIEGDYAYQKNAYSNDLTNVWEKYYTRALSGERYSIIHECIAAKTNESCTFEINFNPIYKKSGEIIGAGCFARNITHKLKTDKAILEQNAKLRNIAALTSHELRGPVASLLGLITVLDRENLTHPDNLEIIDLIYDVSTEVDSVIKQIVDNAFTGYFPAELNNTGK